MGQYFKDHKVHITQLYNTIRIKGAKVIRGDRDKLSQKKRCDTLLTFIKRGGKNSFRSTLPFRGISAFYVRM